MTHTGPCAHCGKTFTRASSSGPAPRYCSAACRSKAAHLRTKADGRYAARCATKQAERVPIRHACTCVVCGERFTTRTAQAKYCKPLCASRAFNSARKVDGRLKEQRTRRADKIKAYQATYGRTLAPCAACGTTVERGPNARHRRTACSNQCRSYLRFGCWPHSQIPATHPIFSTPIPADHPARAPQVKQPTIRFMVGRCPHCGDWFISDRRIGGLTDRTCSPRCSRANHRTIRRARQRIATTETVSRYEIYERDKWTCHICRKKVNRNKTVPHPKAPVLDHVIPLARGGHHERANLRTAHFLCNSLKGAQSMGEQLMLFG